MSRGGMRGGFRGRPRVGGVDVPWEIDFAAAKEYEPDQTYPPVARPAYQKPPCNAERRQVAAYRRLRDNIHEGDFYTVLGVNGSRIGKKKTQAPIAPRFDAFESMQTYSHKYTKHRRRLPRLQGRSFVMRFFPKELWSTISPNYGKEANGLPDPKRRALRIHRADKRSRMEMGMDRAGREMLDDVDDDPDDRSRDDELEKDDFDDDPVDDNFEDEEDDDDVGNDYNAEKYFDGGDEDGGDDDLGGGAGGGDDDGL